MNRKKASAIRVSTAPKIDGILNDASWANAPELNEFIMMRPDNGKKEQNSHKTTVKLVYDDNAIYISAKMFDPNPLSIPKEFTIRDRFANSDFFMFTINPNDDGQNSFMFFITAAGVQLDAKVSNGNNTDYSWNAVWKSKVKINTNNWIVEVKIPYRALRFTNAPIQSWGFNFHRDIKNLNARFTWNHINNTQGSWTQYDGLIENFKNITPPTRLTFYPYASSTLINKNGYSTFDWSIGMDLKYGVTENFTLDATLIPDFSQVAFDNVQLNLSPFEQQFAEQRPFFNEGTELFTKGKLFYSRRIGSSPILSPTYNSNTETLIDNPNKVQMLNAIKISGRTKKGLGIGFFNAITKKTTAKIKNNITQKVRKETINPFSNYNIMVLDQQFNKNSSVTLINTNVTRVGDFRDANITGLLWHVENKQSSYNIDGAFKMSNISDDSSEKETGYSFKTSIGKHSGNWRAEIGYALENKDYNPNDLGILFRNNKQTLYGNLGYRILKPIKNINNGGVNMYYNFNWLHASGSFTNVNAGIVGRFNTKNRFKFSGSINFRYKGKDFFEPREGSDSGIYFKTPTRLNINHWASSDKRKKISVSYFWYYTFFKNNPKNKYGFRIAPKFRFNNLFSIQYRFEYGKTANDQGFVRKILEDDLTDDISLAPYQNQILFGQRDRGLYNNSLSGKYSFNTKSSLSLTFRHNWSKVTYQKFLKLNTTNGLLEPSTYYKNHNINFNNWNLELNYLWQFAPGSQLITFYRHSIFARNKEANVHFFENIEKLFNKPQIGTFSLRLVYFIDYNKLKNSF